ncbi:protein ALP1-like, partial [Aphis craccivora]
ISTLPKRALYDFELIKIARLLKIPHFIGVFTRDKLPVRPKRFESVIVNLDTVNGTGTHWVAYKKI